MKMDNARRKLSSESTSAQNLTSNPISNRKNNIPIIIVGVVLLFVAGIGAYLLGTSNSQLPTQYPQQTNINPTTNTSQVSYSADDKVIAYRWNNELWITDMNGMKQKLYIFRSDDVPFSANYLRLWVSSDNKYIIWFSPKRGILRYNIVNNKLDTIETFDEQITDSIGFYSDISMINNEVYYLDSTTSQLISVNVINGSRREVKIPRKFDSFQLSPNNAKVLLGLHHGGPASTAEHAIMNIDSSGYIDLPFSFERYGPSARIWSNDSKSILQTKGSNELVRFNANTGVETPFAKLPSKDDVIDDCRYINDTLYCRVRSISTQQSKWYEVKNGTFQTSDFTLPKVSDNSSNPTVYYENGSYYVVEYFTFDDYTKDYYTLWLIDNKDNKKQIIDKFTNVSLPVGM